MHQFLCIFQRCDLVHHFHVLHFQLLQHYCIITIQHCQLLHIYDDTRTHSSSTTTHTKSSVISMINPTQQSLGYNRDEKVKRRLELTRSLSGAMLLAVALHRSFTSSPYLCAMLPRAPSGLDLHISVSNSNYTDISTCCVQ